VYFAKYTFKETFSGKKGLISYAGLLLK